MEITFHNVTKKFVGQTVLTGLDMHIASGEKIAIAGHNGSGKSTLLKLVYRSILPTHGSIAFRQMGQALPDADIPHRMSFAAPYLELIEELTALEFLNFYRRFRAFRKPWHPQSILRFAYLQEAQHKRIANFSSGMKQRLKLALALFSESDAVLLDEPLSNLDTAGMDWYRHLLDEHLQSRTLLIASNAQHQETYCCQRTLQVEQYKPGTPATVS